MTAHTRGPWILTDYHQAGWVITSENRRIPWGGYNQVAGYHPKWDGLRTETDTANAALIAAAPELLAALTFLVDAAETEPGMNLYRAHIQQARKVIAKATGG